MTLKISTWNVNSVRARLPNVIDYLRAEKPDIVCLQELKCQAEQFPHMEIEDLGYNIALVGQKTYNGVAILSKFPIDEVAESSLPNDELPEEARYIEAVISANGSVLRVASIYLPNGGDPEGERFPRKLRFLERLHDHAKTLLEYGEILVLAGDYNVAPEDIDVFDPERLRGKICFHPEEQARFRQLTNLNLSDAYRAARPDQQQFTWWDYRAGGYQKNHGMRIDHLLLSPEAADICSQVGTSEDTRAAQKASDHIPVWIELDI